MVDVVELDDGLDVVPVADEDEVVVDCDERADLDCQRLDRLQDVLRAAVVVPAELVALVLRSLQHRLHQSELLIDAVL